MSKQSATETLHELIKRVRAEAYQEGYDAAMREMEQYAATLLDQSTGATGTASASTSASSSASGRAPRGHVKYVVRMVLTNNHPRAMGPTEIQRTAAEYGEHVAPSSVRHALKQLHEAGEVEHHGSQWRLASSKEEGAGSADQSSPATSLNDIMG